MTKLIWDAVATRKYELGVSKTVLFVSNGSGAYNTGVAWNGATSITDSPDGAKETDLYADNMKYASFRSAETFSGTIEAYTFPDEFMACDGIVEMAPGVSFGQQGRKSFGMSYRTEQGNDVDDSMGYKLHIIYGATASPSQKKYKSESESPDAVTFSWEYKTTPVSTDGIVLPPGVKHLNSLSSIVLDSTKCDLKALEAALYGGEGLELKPRLPLPAEVLTLVKPLAKPLVTSTGLGK